MTQNQEAVNIKNGGMKFVNGIQSERFCSHMAKSEISVPETNTSLLHVETDRLLWGSAQ